MFLLVCNEFTSALCINVFPSSTDCSGIHAYSTHSATTLFPWLSLSLPWISSLLLIPLRLLPFFCGYYLAFLIPLCFFIPFFIMKSCAILPSVIKYLPFVIFCGWVSWLQIVFPANSIVLSSLKVVSRQGSLPSKVRHVY